MSKYNIKKYFDDCLIEIENKLKTDGTTTNLQLNKLGYQLFGDKYKGAKMSDQIPRLKNNEMCIINTDPTYKKGLHWLGLYKYDNKIYVYDSFGRNYKTLSPHFKNKRWINVNKTIEEADTGKDCGQLSMTFLLTFDKFKLKCVGII